jgi:hypothetical protein
MSCADRNDSLMEIRTMITNAEYQRLVDLMLPAADDDALEETALELERIPPRC